jgi:TolB-like protein/class 3 adenylate cyclase/Tfp pilus assembly protein PilF
MFCVRIGKIQGPQVATCARLTPSLAWQWGPSLLQRDMPEERDKHRLACAMFADVVGYTRMVEANEAQTLRAFDDICGSLVRPSLEQWRGRLIKLTGDGFLAEFRSAVSAVECGMAIQSAMASRDSEPHIAFRIGLHLGEIIEEGGDLYGHDVNLAARLETICEPEGLCVSNAVYEAVRGKIVGHFEDGGIPALHNIERPVHVWHWAPQSRSFGLSSPQTTGPPARPARPSIAVLPFTNMSEDPAQEYFADGLVEEIITAISRLRWLFVIARNSTFAYKGRAVDIRQVSRELGVRYVLEGSVRKSADRVRISAQLIDGATGSHIWAETMNGPLAEIFDLEDTIAQSVAGAIEPKLRSAEIERARRKPVSNDAYDLYLRSLPHMVAGTAWDLETALAFLERAVALDPLYAIARAAIASCRLRQFLIGAERATPAFLSNAVAAARKAVELDPTDADVLSAAAIVVSLMEKDYAAGKEWIDISMRLNPNSCVGWYRNGYIHCWLGDFAAGVEDFKRAMRLSPFDLSTYMFQAGLGMAYMFQHDWPTAIDWLRRSLSNNRHFAPAYRYLVVCLVQSGRIAEAREVVGELTRLDPLTSIRRSLLSGMRDEEPKRLYVESLRQAGLPE